MRRAACAFLALAVGALAPRASAELGGRAETVLADQARMKGTLRSKALGAYAVHEIGAASGTSVREFASADGMVFGVAWEGPFQPDFKQLLGRSFEAFAQAAQAKRRGRGPLLVQSPELVLESAGHPRAFHGRAYVPSLVPAGVATEDIR